MSLNFIALNVDIVLEFMLGLLSKVYQLRTMGIKWVVIDILVSLRGSGFDTFFQFSRVLFIQME